MDPAPSLDLLSPIEQHTAAGHPADGLAAAHLEIRARTASPPPLKLEPLDLAHLLSDDGFPDPDYIVDGLFARGTVSMLTGDTGTGKSWLSLALAHSVATGTPWLGRTVKQGTVLVVDEENPQTVVLARLRAFGLSIADAPRVHYMSRCGASVGDVARTDDALNAYAGEHCPSLVIVYTAIAATAVEDPNDNGRVAALYGVLRTFAERHQCAVLILHHTRKNGGGSRGEAAMGARSWIGQADAHLALDAGTCGIDEPDGDGSIRKWTRATLSYPKLRDDVPPGKSGVLIESLTSENRRLSLATVTLIDAADTAPAVESEADRLAAEILAAATDHGEDMAAGDLAAAVNRAPNDGTFKRARSSLIASGDLESPARGVYRVAVPL